MSGGLRFCMLTTFYPPFNFGGDGIAVERLSRALARRGHSVTVIHDVDAYRSLTGGAEPEPVRPTPGVEVIGLRSRLGAASTALTQQLGRPVVHGARIRRLLREGRYDVVNFHNVSLVGGPGLLGLETDAVRIYMAHEHWLVCPTHVLWRHNREPCEGRECLRCVLHHRRPPQLWRFTGSLERAVGDVDAFIAMSEFSREKHREMGFRRDMEVVPLFLPDRTADLVPPEPADLIGEPYHLFVGRLERMKGLDDVIPLFSGSDGPALVIAGDGNHGPALRRLAAGLPRVRFLGRVPGEGLDELYRGALSLIVPSVCFETFGIIVIEAFRQGVPVIARDIGPLPELVTASGAGHLFRTPEELRAAMSLMERDPAERRRMGAAGARAFDERWSESVVVPRYLGVVARAARARGHASAATLEREAA